MTRPVIRFAMLVVLAAGCTEQQPAQQVDPGSPPSTSGGVGGGGSDPYNTPTTCSSATYWQGGDHESPYMHPGYACIDCHEQNFGPSLKVAGTLYPTAHEPDDCNGVGMAGYQVIITDATGAEMPVSVNSAGNFVIRSRTPFTFPITAKVVSPDGTERAMSTPQSSADCNSCHTEQGANGAPGRILAP